MMGKPPELLSTTELRVYGTSSKPNGCGNSMLSRFLAKLLQRVAGITLCIACNKHDEEWGIPKRVKSVSHWRESNFNFLFNMMLLCGEPEVSFKYRLKLRVCSIFYGAVMLNNYDDYYRGRKR